MFGVYIHWPFCLSKCPYCDFNSHVSDHIDQESWRQAYQKEIEYTASMVPDHIVTSIYFGGGTPSLMEPKTVEYILEQVSKNWRHANNVEITLEANPTSIEQQKFQDFREAGINRVSVGVQALNDKDLKFLGRQHSSTEAKKALEVAYNTFDRVSFDLIYARPDQTKTEWEKELHEALSLAKAGHLSLYQLTIEPGTAFETMYQRKEFSIPNDELGGELYEMTGDICAKYGLENYEISNYAQKGEESRHNLTYWQYEDYAGIGPGAHGRLTVNNEKLAMRTHRAPKIWLENVSKNKHAYHPFTKIDQQERTIECLLMGLRTEEGIPLKKLEKEGGDKWDVVLDKKKLEELRRAGYISQTQDSLKLSNQGRQRLNKVLEQIIR